MINRELIERVKRIYYEKNLSASDKLLANRHIFNKLVSSRNRVIAQEANRSNSISDWCYQSLNILLVNDVEGFDSSSYGVTIRKSLIQIPEILNDGTKPLIKLVSDIAGKRAFYRTTWDQKKNISGNKYTSNRIYYYIFNDYLYLVNAGNLSKVAVTAIFTDPLVEDTTVPFLDRRFPADARLIDSIIALTIDELSGKKTQQEQQHQQNTNQAAE